MKPHKHAELIKAWADGAEIEIKDRVTGWWGAISIGGEWYEEDEYRIKPEPKPDVVKSFMLTKANQLWDVETYIAHKPNLKLTFDGGTGELKDAEVFK